jgi:hypothetical protein
MPNTRRSLLAALALLLVSSCAENTQTTSVDNVQIGGELKVGATQSVTLPPSQYQRLHIRPAPGAQLRLVVTATAGASPLSLSLYPMVAGGAADSYSQPGSDFALKPFQRTGVPPLDASLRVPDTWTPRDVVVLELKNLGAAVAELVVRLEM